jgi:hypothetical protein
MKTSFVELIILRNDNKIIHAIRKRLDNNSVILTKIQISETEVEHYV